MKKIYLVILILLAAVTTKAQVPQKFSYQAVIRNNSNALITNQAVSERISLVKDSANGTVVYSETQNVKTNANGLVSLQIGTGSALSGSFSGINWGAGDYFIKIETDPTGGNKYTINTTAQLLSVPYALYAANGGTPGPQGIQGPKGDSGARGLQGIQGIQGLKGDKGDQGIQGIQGLTGATGAKGDSGARGLQGIQGIQGVKGDKGDQGIQGIQGLTGATGAKGDSGAIGLQGIQGIQGVKGATGVKGDSGVSVRSTVVVGDSLYVTLSTGQKINAGNVRGLKGIGVDSINAVNDSLYVHKSNGVTQNAGALITPSTIGYGFSNFKVFKDSGTFYWIPPVGVTKVMVEAWAGGDGGSEGLGSGGNAGNYGKGIYNVISGKSYKIVVGPGGLPNNGNTNNPGGVSSFDTLMNTNNAPVVIKGGSSITFVPYPYNITFRGSAANSSNSGPGASGIGFPASSGNDGMLIIWW